MAMTNSNSYLMYEICTDEYTMESQNDFTACMLSYLNKVKTDLDAGQEYYRNRALSLKIRVLHVNYFGNGSFLVKYNAKFNGDRIVFYHGCRQSMPLGSLISFLSEMNIVPRKELAVYYDDFMEYVRSNRGQVNRSQVVHTESLRQVPQTHSTKRTQPPSRPRPTEPKRSEKEDISQLLKSTLDSINMLSSDISVDRLDDFEILDEKDRVEKEEKEKKRLERIRKREEKEIEMRNKIYEAELDREQNPEKYKKRSRRSKQQDRDKKVKQRDMDRHKKIDNTDEDYKRYMNEGNDQGSSDNDTESNDLNARSTDGDSDDGNESTDTDDLDEENRDLVDQLDAFYQSNKDLQASLEEHNEVLEKDMNRLADIECELRDIKNIRERDRERKEQDRRIFRSDKRSYVKLCNDIANPAKKFITEDRIPPFFDAKYPILKFMEENGLLELDGAFDDSVEIDDFEFATYQMFNDAIDTVNNMLDDPTFEDDGPLIVDPFTEDDTAIEELTKLYGEFVDHVVDIYQKKNEKFVSDRSIMEGMNEEDDNEENAIFRETATGDNNVPDSDEEYVSD